MANLRNYLDEHGRIDLEALEQAAEEARAARQAEQAAAFERMIKRERKRREYWQNILDKAGERTAAEKEAEAQRRIEQAKKEANEEIEERIKKEVGVPRENSLDRAYRQLHAALTGKDKKDKDPSRKRCRW